MNKALIALCVAPLCAETFVLTNARIVPVSAPVIERGSIVVQDGKIAAVGAQIKPPAGAKKIDATGLTVYPGLVDGLSTWGMATVLAIAIAPSLGLFLFHFGWHWVCGTMVILSLGMVLISHQVPEQHHSGALTLRGLLSGGVLNRGVFVLSLTLFLYSFGYGGITSFVALYA